MVKESQNLVNVVSEWPLIKYAKFNFRLADVTVNHSYLEVSLVIWSGIYLFFLIERFLKIFMESQNRKKDLELGHAHQPFCSEDDEPKNEGHCSGKPRIFTFVPSHNRMTIR